MKQQVAAGITAGLVAAVLAGCAPQPAVSPTYDFSQVERVGVLQFDSYGDQPSSGEVIANQFAIELLRQGYEVIERRRLRAVLRDHKLQHKRPLTPAEVRELGYALGVDALLTGAVMDYTPSRREVLRFDSEEDDVDDLVHDLRLDSDVFILAEGPNYVTYLTQAHVGVSVRLIDVGTGEVVWATSGESSAFSLEQAVQWAVSRVLSSLPRGGRDTD
jgi:hypothetical protein